MRINSLYLYASFEIIPTGPEILGRYGKKRRVLNLFLLSFPQPFLKCSQLIIRKPLLGWFVRAIRHETMQ